MRATRSQPGPKPGQGPRGSGLSFGRRPGDGDEGRAEQAECGQSRFRQFGPTWAVQNRGQSPLDVMIAGDAEREGGGRQGAGREELGHADQRLAVAGRLVWMGDEDRRVAAVLFRRLQAGNGPPGDGVPPVEPDDADLEPADEVVAPPQVQKLVPQQQPPRVCSERRKQALGQEHDGPPLGPNHRRQRGLGKRQPRHPPQTDLGGHFRRLGRDPGRHVPASRRSTRANRRTRRAVSSK